MRKAKSSEILENSFEKVLGVEEYALVHRNKQFVYEKELVDIPIKTCFDKDIQAVFPELKFVFEEHCEYLNGDVWMARWDDITDEMGLFIPIN